MTEKGLARRLPEEAYRVLDLLDEEMMEMELAGLEARDLIYSFEIEGRPVTGLSWEGAKALARWMADRGHPLDAVEKDLSQDEDAWYADVKVVDKETGLGLWGSSTQTKTKKVHVVDDNGRWVKNPDGSWKMKEKPERFSRTIALNKAQRNAIRAHVPDKWIAQFIKDAIEEGRVRKVSPREVEEKRRPPKRVPAQQVKPKLKPLTRKILEYNLFNAMGVPRDAVGVVEKENGFLVKPKRHLTDEEDYTITGVIEDLGGVWEQRGLAGVWVIGRSKA